MGKNDMSIMPARLEGIRPDGTMFATLYGELMLHPWRDPVAAMSDAYSLFHARSSAMGWLTRAVEHASVGAWGMNDAGQDPDSEVQGVHRIWFQVSVSDPLPDDRPLPVQPFLACAGNVVARMGTFRLDAIQVLLPVQSISKATDKYAVLTDAGWFADCNPHLTTRVRVILDGGQNPSIRSAAPKMVEWIQELKQEVFTCDAFSLTDDAKVLPPIFGDQLWLGPPQHRATFYGSLVEWSLDGLGWLALLLASASAQHGISTPLVLTVSHSEGSVLHSD